MTGLIAPTHRFIRKYYENVAALRAQGVLNEMSVRSPFESLLQETARLKDWTFIAELSGRSGGALIRPDGTLRDRNSLPRGYWEAKDTQDDLDTEIKRKIARGYPLSNIIFEDTHSDIVMARLRPGLEKLGFRVEKGKSSDDKIVVPVLFGRKGKVLKCFNADAHAASKGWVLEVEAGRAVDNNQFLKDIFQACMMHDVLHLAIAVRNTYRKSDDFAKVESFLETLYISGRLQLPLKGILLIGY
ncbi:MAG TPA: hypothetical protein VKO18_16380 [Terriglobia bacterium]|nr:hypothetical protein [Terriglobia bacterium]